MILVERGRASTGTLMHSSLDVCSSTDWIGNLQLTLEEITTLLGRNLSS